MSTRNLTVVINGEEMKVAQYGQCDGYPEGQGKTVLEFLKGCDLEKFRETLNNVSFLDPEDSKLHERKPELDMFTAAKVLKLIYDGQATELSDSREFTMNSLFCEWVYVINLDDETLEVYRGYNKEPLTEKDRFYNNGYKNGEYYPVKIVKTYSLKKLPEIEQFIKELRPDKYRSPGLSR